MGGEEREMEIGGLGLGMWAKGSRGGKRMLACFPSGLHRVFMQAILFPVGPDGDLADLIGDGHASPVGPSGPRLTSHTDTHVPQ